MRKQTLKLYRSAHICVFCEQFFEKDMKFRKGETPGEVWEQLGLRPKTAPVIKGGKDYLRWYIWAVLLRKHTF